MNRRGEPTMCLWSTRRTRWRMLSPSQLSGYSTDAVPRSRPFCGWRDAQIRKVSRLFNVDTPIIERSFATFSICSNHARQRKRTRCLIENWNVGWLSSLGHLQGVLRNTRAARWTQTKFVDGQCVTNTDEYTSLQCGVEE